LLLVGWNASQKLERIDMTQFSTTQQTLFVESGQLDRARKGNRLAFACLAERHLDALYCFAAREIRYNEACGNLEPGELTPEDVISEMFALALRDVTGMPPGASFKGYLCYLALCVIRRAALASTQWRRILAFDLEELRPWARDPDSDSDATYTGPLTWNEVIIEYFPPQPEAYVDCRETAQALEGALNELPDEQRLVFVLYATEELSYREISVMLGKHLDDVKQLNRAGREALRRWLAEKVDAWLWSGVNDQGSVSAGNP
jgi:RNA polymerase sigma factor (sigma-70 family)